MGTPEPPPTPPVRPTPEPRGEVPPPPAESAGRPILEASPGVVTPLGTVVIRSNRPAPADLPPVAGTPGGTNTPRVADSASVTPSGAFARDVFEVQLALSRLGFSSGSIDGKLGSQTRAAIRAYQEREGLPPTGGLDATTRAKLQLVGEAILPYTVTDEDVQRLRPLAKTWLAKSEQDRMDYETVLELVSEKSHSHPALIRQLNPGVDWDHIAAGSVVQLPVVERPALPGRAASIRIFLSGKVLQLLDAESRVLLHFPCSIAKDKEKRPVGELHVEKIAPNPNYTFNPEVFPESEEARQLNRKLILQPGPNNPVGVAWISLDRPGYGIHGTPSPEQVGRTESHGCFRLANWNAELLVKQVWIGMPVVVEP